MKTFFADTFYYRALLDPRDEHHKRVTNWTKGKRYRTITTEFVLIEVGDEFGKPPPRRAIFVALLEQLQKDGLVEIIPAAPEWVEQGVDHYRKYRDKKWGLTDCISFVVMTSRGVQEALTNDRDFQQAGFVALLR